MTEHKENGNSNYCKAPCPHCKNGHTIDGDVCLDCGGSGRLEKTTCAGFGCKVNESIPTSLEWIGATQQLMLVI